MENWLNGRYTTLKKLHEVRDNCDLPFHVRKGADRSIAKIREQLKDKKLTRMREWLIKATLAGDQVAVWRFENQIRDHEGQERERQI